MTRKNVNFCHKFNRSIIQVHSGVGQGKFIEGKYNLWLTSQRDVFKDTMLAQGLGQEAWSEAGSESSLPSCPGAHLPHHKKKKKKKKETPC
jgi:hypothetical protein